MIPYLITGLGWALLFKAFALFHDLEFDFWDMVALMFLHPVLILIYIVITLKNLFKK